ncbi:hypothetical protein LguiA_024980 [Lonicera macranthoides]
MVMKIEDFVGDWKFELNELLYMLNARPIIGSIEVTKKFEGLEKGVIYKEGPKDELNHCVLIVGYRINLTLGRKFFKIKNSWGTDWCDNGYGLVDKEALVDIGYVIDAKMVPRGEGSSKLKAELSAIHQASELCNTKNWYGVPIETASNNAADILRTAESRHHEWEIIKQCRILK